MKKHKLDDVVEAKADKAKKNSRLVVKLERKLFLTPYGFTNSDIVSVDECNSSYHKRMYEALKADIESQSFDSNIDDMNAGVYELILVVSSYDVNDKRPNDWYWRFIPFTNK